MAHAGGRPTKYDKKYCGEIINYFDVPPQTTAFKKEYYQNGNIKSETPILTACEFPTLQGFAHKIDVNVDTLYEWKEKYQEFSEAIMRAKQIQEKIWLVNGMSNLYNSQFAQFFGKNCLGYKDKQEVDIGNTDDKPFKSEISGLDVADLKQLKAILSKAEDKT